MELVDRFLEKPLVVHAGFPDVAVADHNCSAFARPLDQSGQNATPLPYNDADPRVASLIPVNCQSKKLSLVT